MIDIGRIRQAEKRIGGRAVRTPILSSPFLDEIAGRKVLVKAECLQHTGSFKFRGAWSAVSALPRQQRENGVIAVSSGNHAQGVAIAARRHGVPAVIIMPSDAPAIKINNTRALGAEVVLYDRANEDREVLGSEISSNRGLNLIKPYDNDHVIAGQGTVGLEIGEQAAAVGIESAEVLVCCGGGGLTSGIATALHATAPNLKTRPVEPENFDDVCRSLQSGKIETNRSATGSVCDAILTSAPGKMTFPIMQRLCGSGIVVSDQEALKAMVLAFSRLKIVVEPGGAVALAAALFHPTQISTDTVICVATGGNVDPATFQSALTQYGINS